MNRSRRQTGFTLVELLVVIAIIGVLVALLLPAVQSAREAARRMQCKNNVKQLVLAMHNYHDQNNALPIGALAVGGNFDGHSWYSRILPFIEQSAIYDKTDFKQIAGNNNSPDLRGTQIPGHFCPSDSKVMQEATNPTWRVWRTNYVANFGNTNYGWKDESSVKFAGAPFGITESTGFGDIRDGLSNTMMMAEVITPKGPDYEGYAGIPIYAGGAGYTGYYTPNTIGPDKWARKCYTNLGPGVPGTCASAGGGHPEVANQIQVARSKHTGGVQAGLCDGSVQFFSNSIDVNVWRALASARGAEVVTLP
ncbi:MAG TPA: DUF1559 domain-containing protein [Pirellulaceae bacterium]|nr:DUF1559 domain-containing protein [Pirellulaceae bacterium]